MMMISSFVYYSCGGMVKYVNVVKINPTPEVERESNVVRLICATRRLEVSMQNLKVIEHGSRLSLP